jgi:hypothetical protein
MGQLTERLVREILRYADRDEHPPMTASEVRQLCYSWLQANGKSTHADRPALETPAAPQEYARECTRCKKVVRGGPAVLHPTVIYCSIECAD